MKTSSKTMLGLGAGLAALATASYYFWGPDGKRHQRRMKGWMYKMKGEIIERIEDVKELTEPVYRDIIDSVAGATSSTVKASKTEIKAFAEKLKDQWNDIVDSLENDVEEDEEMVRTSARKIRSKARSSKS